MGGTRDSSGTSLNRLRWVNGTLNVELWADAAHLGGLQEQSAAAGEA